MLRLLRSRKNQMLIPCTLLVVLAAVYRGTSGKPLDLYRILLWSAAGVVLYVAFSRLFGFDPYRTRLPASASPALRYAERFELRSGSATFATLLVVIVAVQLIDRANVLTAVLSATLTAWLYFMTRVFIGGYQVERG